MPKTFTVRVPKTYRDGYGVAVMPIYDDGDRIAEIDVEVVKITRKACTLAGDVVCVFTSDGCVPVENFADVPDLTQDDSHDLRDRWFATKEEAEDHAESVRSSWDHPNPWQSFVVLS